jgi:hypothetical protein
MRRSNPVYRADQIAPLRGPAHERGPAERDFAPLAMTACCADRVASGHAEGVPLAMTTFVTFAMSLRVL